MIRVANNEIQAKTPEVGDVWQSTRRNAQKIYITHVMGRVYCITEQGVASTRFFSDFGKDGTYRYLGKSKVNIEDFFKTENE